MRSETTTITSPQDGLPLFVRTWQPDGEAKGAGPLSLTIDGRAYPAVSGATSDAEAPVGEIRDGARTALGHAYGGGSQYFSMWLVGADKPQH